jgi:hypothetical protein
MQDSFFIKLPWSDTDRKRTSSNDNWIQINKALLEVSASELLSARHIQIQDIVDKLDFLWFGGRYKIIKGFFITWDF